MKLQIATVLACTTDGCLVQPIDGSAAIASRYTENDKKRSRSRVVVKS